MGSMLLIGLIALAIAAYWMQQIDARAMVAARLAHIQNYAFSPELLAKLAKHYPQLEPAQLEPIQQGLRDYFMLCAKYGGCIAMPSRAVDTLWHEFILYTQDYQAFCQQGFGKFLHHIPFSAMASPQQVRLSLANAWQYSCEAEGINPVIPDRLPFLFALDKRLDISDSCAYSIERGEYPQPKLSVPPDTLLKGILQRLNPARKAATRQQEIEQLGRILKPYLLDDGYCKSQGGTALTPLFAAVLEHEALAIAVFGSTALGRKREKQVKQFADPASCGGGGGCGGCGGC